MERIRGMGERYRMMPVVEHASANAMIVKLEVKGEVCWLKMGGFWKEMTCRKYIGMCTVVYFIVLMSV